MQLNLSTKITRSLLLFACLLGGTLVSKAQTALVAGDVVFIGWNSTDNMVNGTAANDDNFNFLLLRDITAGTVIYFTDFGWTGTGFQHNQQGPAAPCGVGQGAQSDGCVMWTSSSAMTAGTQVRIDCKVSLTASSGAVAYTQVSGTALNYVNLGIITDQLFAFQSSNAGDPLNGTLTLIAALMYGGSWSSVTQCQFTSSLSGDPSASVGGYDMEYTGGDDNAYYSGATTSGSPATLRAALINPTNWTGTVGANVMPMATSFAVGIAWQGTTSNWFTTSNWSCTCTPSSSEDVIIPTGQTAYPNISSGTATVKSITINSGGTVIVSSSGVLQIAGSVSNSGTFTASAGGITFNGSTAQAIPGSSFTGSTIEDLVINNAAGVSISSSLNIAATGSLTVSSGTLTTGGNLTMLSTASGTARVANSAGTVSGLVNIQRYIAGGRRAYRFLAHPFTTSQGLNIISDDIDITGTGGATNGFTPTVTNHPSALWYNVATANGSASNDLGWTGITNTNGAGANAWDKGEGMNVLVRGTPGQGLNGSAYTPNAVTLDMTGTINQGSQVLTATKGTGSFYAFMGNPFPCQIDMSQISRAANVANNVYIWNAQGGTKGTWISTNYASAFILPSCAGFVAVVAANISNTLTINESAKSGGTPGTMLKPTSTSDKVQFSITSYNDSIWWDQLMFFFDNNTSNDSEWSNDAAKFVNPDVTFYSYSNDNKKLAIDSRPYKNGEIIPLGLEKSPAGSYTLKADEFNMAAGNNVFFHDKYLNKAIPVTPGFVYNFDVTSDPLTQGNRFALEMSVATSVEPIKTASALKVEISPNPVHDVATIKYTSPVNGKADIRVINMQGAVCRQLSSDIHATGSIQVPMSSLPNGVYMIELTSGGQTVTQKLIKE